jgi:hypothetical protein
MTNKTKRITILLAVGLILIMGLSYKTLALNYVEDFEDAFPAWESEWLGSNSNLHNYYGVGADRGNNPDGLWIDDGDGNQNSDSSLDILFTPAFGSTLTSFSIDVAGWANAQLRIFNMANALLLDVPISLTQGALTNPGVYAHYSASSNNGISGFSFIPLSSTQVEGNTGIDNVVVSNDYQPAVPEPTTISLLSLGLLGLVFRRKKTA